MVEIQPIYNSYTVNDIVHKMLMLCCLAVIEKCE